MTIKVDYLREYEHTSGKDGGTKVYDWVWSSSRGRDIQSKRHIYSVISTYDQNRYHDDYNDIVGFCLDIQTNIFNVRYILVR